MHRRVGLFPPKSKPKFFVRSGVKYTPIRKRSLPPVDVDELEFEAEYTSGEEEDGEEEEDEEEEAESSEEESDEEEEGGAGDDEDEDNAELTKFR
jgi:hypothetical protein